VLSLYKEKEKDMAFADKLRKEIADRDQQIINNEILPKKEQILNAVSEGIKRIGYVCIDTGYGTSSHEGLMVGIHDCRKLNALAKFLQGEGFKVSKMWWGMGSCDGDPDMLKIRL
jgi:hypothetical protein